MPFSLEGFAFFTEAIFLGIYLYGWKRVSPVLHWLAGIVVAVSGILSAVFVVLVNSWMNAPAGFNVANGQLVNINPIAARKANYALQIPFGLSILVGYNPATKVAGLEAFPRDQWPDVRLVHWSFDIMVERVLPCWRLPRGSFGVGGGLGGYRITNGCCARSFVVRPLASLQLRPAVAAR
jgi:cytochrome bd-type quinol oxidase subunit 1